MLSILIWILGLVFGYFLYKKGTENEDFFRDSGIKYAKPTFLMGNTTDFILGRKNLFDVVKQFYDQFPDEKAVGIYEMRTPIIILRDPALIKRIAVKEFDHFMDHRVFIGEDMDDLFGKSLISLTGQKWRNMRTTLSPAFTGSKMRQMFDLVVQVCDHMMDHIKKEASKNGVVEYEMKEFCSRFTNDVIASCAFGLKVNSLDDDKNEFFVTGKKMMDFNQPSRILKLAGFKLVPQLMKSFNIQLFGDVKDYFKGIITETMNVREKEGIYHPDMINLLMELRKGQSEGSDIKGSNRLWTDDELIAQCFLFFFAGFDTIATVVSFGVYELTVNPEVQNKLYEEIKEVHESLQGKTLSYEILNKMTYLDMVVSEILRKRTPNPFMDRICVKDIDFDDEDGFKYKFTKGQMLWIPIYALLQDESHFPNPDKFDPDRFSEENKQQMNQDAYIPFGVGPRNCIGSRFALMEIKAVLFHLILNFSFNVVEKTQIPLQFKKSIQLQTTNGIWIGLKHRT